MRLYTVRDGQERPALVLGDQPLRIGRLPSNDLVIDHDPTVSGEHATVWREGGAVFVRDLGSRNGTFVNGKRVRRAELHDGDKLNVGAVRLVVRGSAAPAPRVMTVRVLEDVDAGVRYPFVGDRMVVGPGSRADLRLEVPGDVALKLHADGEIWRSALDDDGPLALGEVFELGERRFRVVEVEASDQATVELSERQVRYQLQVSLDGPHGARAVITDPDTGRSHIVGAETRVNLLYVLVRAKLSPDDLDDGWVSDMDAGVGVWGRQFGADSRKLHVLIHRLRKEIADAGFEPWFIDKKRRAIRLALDDVGLG